MIEVFYCTPSDFSQRGYATGSQRFNSWKELGEWLELAATKGPVLITYVVGPR